MKAKVKIIKNVCIDDLVEKAIQKATLVNDTINFTHKENTKKKRERICKYYPIAKEYNVDKYTGAACSMSYVRKKIIEELNNCSFLYMDDNGDTEALLCDRFQFSNYENQIIYTGFIKERTI